MRTFLCAALLSLALSNSASASPLHVTGVSDGNIPHYMDRAQPHLVQIRATTTLVFLWWDAGQTSLYPIQRTYIAQAKQLGTQVVVALTSHYGGPHPRSGTRREQFCSTAQDVARQGVYGIQVGNESNTVGFFGETEKNRLHYLWLLDLCYSKIKAVAPSTLVVGFSLAPSHDPGDFIKDVGTRYRQENYGQIADVYGHHPYPANGTEPPNTLHAGTFIGMGDIDDLRDALTFAFNGTVQQDRAGQVIWYTESGVTDEGETPTLLSNPDPVGWYEKAYRLAACQNRVWGYLGFQLLSDAGGPGHWQTGLLRGDWTPKGDLSRIGSVAEASRSGTVNCSVFPRRMR